MKKVKGLSMLPIKTMDERGIEHENGWVTGWYADGFIIGDMVEVEEDYITFEFWCPVISETVEVVGKEDKLDELYYIKIGELYFSGWIDSVATFVTDDGPGALDQAVKTPQRFAHIYFKGLDVEYKLEVTENE